MSRVEVRDKRLPPPSSEADEYVLGLLGSEGNSYIHVRLTPEQVKFLLHLRDEFDAKGKGFGFIPGIELYHGRLANIGTKDDPVWEPKGKPVRIQRRIR